MPAPPGASGLCFGSSTARGDIDAATSVRGPPAATAPRAGRRLRIRRRDAGRWRPAQGAAVPVGFSFSAPIYAAAPAGDPRLFIVERAGVIRVLQDWRRSRHAVPRHQRPRGDPAVREGGLLGLAFAPDYAQSGVFYVYYTGDGDPSGGFTFESRVSPLHGERGPATSNLADPQETILFRVDQPDTNHNGGTIAIRDGFLYLGLGDGGGGGDPDELAQNDALALRQDAALRSLAAGAAVDARDLGEGPAQPVPLQLRPRDRRPLHRRRRSGRRSRRSTSSAPTARAVATTAGT